MILAYKAFETAKAGSEMPLWLSGLVEEDEVGDDNPAHRQDERSGDLEEAESSEDWLGTLEAIVK